MAARHYKFIATVILDPKNAIYRATIVRRSERPDQVTWTEALMMFSIDHPDDWKQHSYGLIGQARSSFGSRVKELGKKADIDPDIIRITIRPADRKVRMDS